MEIMQLLKYETITIGEALNVSVTGFIVVLLILALLAVLVLLLSKAVRAVEGKTKKMTEIAEKAESKSKNAPAAPKGTPLPETSSAGHLDLYDVDEKTAAVIMAIVSHESGIPLNRLQFKSIKAIEK